MSVEVGSGGGMLPSGPEHTTHQMHQSTDFSSMTTEWLRKQLDGPTNPPMPFDMYGGPFTEEIMGAYSLLPEGFSSQYDPVIGQLPFSFDGDSTTLQTSHSSSFAPATTDWQANNPQPVFSEPPSDPRFISPKALTTPPGMINDAQRSSHIPPSPIDLNTHQALQSNQQIPFNNLSAPFGYVSNSRISSAGTNTPITQAGYITTAHTTALPNASRPQTSTGADEQVPAIPVYARPIYGNDPGFRHNTFRPSTDVARGAAKVEAFQDRAVFHNIFHPNDQVDINLFAPPGPTEGHSTRRAKRNSDAAGLSYENGSSPTKRTRTSISRPTKHEPTSDAEESPSSSTSPVTTAASQKRRTKSSHQLDHPSSPPPSTANRVTTSTTNQPPPRPRPAPKSAEERRKRHNESEKRRRDYFKVLRERLFSMVSPFYDINSKTIGAKHKAVVKWVIELRRGNLALWERAEAEGIDVEELELGSKGGKEELRREPRLFFERDGVCGGDGNGSGGGGGGGGRGEDAETGLKRILGTMEAIKMAGGD